MVCEFCGSITLQNKKEEYCAVCGLVSELLVIDRGMVNPSEFVMPWLSGRKQTI